MEAVLKIVPSTPKITLQQCEEIIKKKFNNNYKIVDYNLLHLNEKCGFLGEHCHLNITIKTNFNKTKEVYCFAKFLPNTQTQIDFVIFSGAFKKEIYMYDQLFPKIKELKIDYLQSCIPECYFTKENFVLITENITKLNYKTLNKYDYLDFDHVIVVLKSLAKLHASSLIYEEMCSEILPNKYKIIDDHETYFYETFFLDTEGHKGGQGVYASIKGLQVEVDIFFKEKSDIFKEEFKKWLEIAGLDLFEKVKPSNKYRNVLCHGDLWNTNIMIKYNNDKPQECILFDFQTMRFCPIAHDFMSFIHLTTSREFRKQNFQKLQDFYYGELDQLLKNYEYKLNNLIRKTEFIESCNDQKRYAAILTATYCQMTQIKNEYITDFIQDDIKWNEAMYTDRSLMVTVNCERDFQYKNKLQETMEELKEIFEQTTNV